MPSVLSPSRINFRGFFFFFLGFLTTVGRSSSSPSGSFLPSSSSLSDIAFAVVFSAREQSTLSSQLQRFA